MAIGKLFLVSALFVAGLQEIHGHGKMIEPINRSSVWRLNKYSDVVANYEDNQNFCGGLFVQIGNNGQCGPCGDNVNEQPPRRNENGGTFGKGHVVRRYRSGETINVKIDLSANHKGHFEFSICKLNGPRAVEQEQCFDQHKLEISHNGQKMDKFDVSDGRRGIIELNVILPQGLRCKRCVLRWHYRGGNNSGICSDGKELLGCGPQETFRSCSDIAID